MPFQVQTSEMRISVPGSVLWRHKGRLASLKFAMKKITIFGKIWPALILIRCGKIISRKRRVNKLSIDVYCLIVQFLKVCLLWRNTELPRV